MNAFTKLKIKTWGPIDDLVTWVTTKSAEDVSALQASAMIKRAEVLLDTARKQLRGAANREFAKMAQQSTLTHWELLGGLVLLERFTPRGTWKYPPHIVKLEADLKAAQKKAQLDKTATKVDKAIDLDVDSTFSLEIKEQFDG